MILFGPDLRDDRYVLHYRVTLAAVILTRPYLWLDWLVRSN